MPGSDFLPLDAPGPWVWQGVTGGRRAWALTSEAGEVARVSWPKMLSSLAVAESLAGAWTFKATGFTGRRISVRRREWDHNIAVMERGWGWQGRLEFVGRRFRWKRQNFWATRWAWEADDGAVLTSFRVQTSLRSRCEVTPTRDGYRFEELPILLCLGWYLIVLQRQQSAVAASG